MLKKLYMYAIERTFKKRFGERSELHFFISKNRLHIILVVICLMVFLKNSQAPFLWEYTEFTKLLFRVPERDSISATFLDWCNNLGMAYLSSLLFYYLVDYFPKRRRQKTAYLLIVDRIEQIDRMINQLISYLMFLAGTGERLEQLSLDDVSKLCGISVGDISHPCHTVDSILQTDEVEMEGNPDYIHEITSLKDVCKGIISQIDEIMSLPYAANIENELLEVMGILKKNRMIVNLASMPEKMIRNIGKYVPNYSAKDVGEVIIALFYMRRYKYPKHKFVTTAATEESIESAKHVAEELREKFPDSFELMEKLRNQS